MCPGSLFPGSLQRRADRCGCGKAAGVTSGHAAMRQIISNRSSSSGMHCWGCASGQPLKPCPVPRCCCDVLRCGVLCSAGVCRVWLSHVSWRTLTAASSATALLAGATVTTQQPCMVAFKLLHSASMLFGLSEWAVLTSMFCSHHTQPVAECSFMNADMPKTPLPQYVNT